MKDMQSEPEPHFSETHPYEVKDPGAPHLKIQSSCSILSWCVRPGDCDMRTCTGHMHKWQTTLAIPLPPASTIVCAILRCEV